MVRWHHRHNGQEFEQTSGNGGGQRSLADYSQSLGLQESDTVQFSRVRLFATSWEVGQASLSVTNSQSPPKPMSIVSVMPSNHLILCCPLLLLPSIFLSIRVFSSELLFASGGQSIGASASASVLSMNIQGCFPLGLTSLISLLSRNSQGSSPTLPFKSSKSQ